MPWIKPTGQSATWDGHTCTLHEDPQGQLYVLTHPNVGSYWPLRHIEGNQYRDAKERIWQREGTAMTTDDIQDNVPSILDDFIEHVDSMLKKQGIEPTHKERLFYIHALFDNMVTPGYISSWLAKEDRIIS